MPRFLITTALEESWRASEPVLFLGDWCRRYSRRDRWSTMDAKVVRASGDDDDRFPGEYRRLQDLYERNLTNLAAALNRIHGVDHRDRYWRILVGPWLAAFIHIAFDRWSSIRMALERHEISETICLARDDDALVGNDMAEFMASVTGDEWNHWFFSVLLEEFTKTHCIHVPYEPQPKPESASGVGLTRRLLAAYDTLARPLTRSGDAFLAATYLSPIDEIRLHRRIGQVPHCWIETPPARVSVDWSQRDWRLHDEAGDSFEAIVLELLPRLLPTAYLEGYERLVDQARGQAWPTRPRVIFTSNVLWHSAVAKAYVAEKVEAGAPLVHGQHGGVYGVTKFTWAEEHEVAVADRYLTWGWEDEAVPKLEPVGMFKPPTRAQTRAVTPQRNLLLITLNKSRYLYRMSRSCALSEQSIDEWFEFAGDLPQEARDRLIVRLTATEYGWDLFHRWKDRFPTVQIDQGTSKLVDLMRDARLIVCVSNSTAFLEALAADIPTIIFYDPAGHPLRDTALPLFRELQRVGVHHGTPSAAAAHAANVWSDVNAWWRDPEVRAAVDCFRHRYCRVRDDIVGAVARALESAGAARGGRV